MPVRLRPAWSMGQVSGQRGYRVRPFSKRIFLQNQYFDYFKLRPLVLDDERTTRLSQHSSAICCGGSSFTYQGWQTNLTACEAVI